MLKRIARKIFFLPKPKQAALSIASAAGTAAVLYAFYPLVAVVAITLVLITHEGGHVIAATATGTKSSLPVFVPASVVAFGFTIVVKSRGLRRFLIYASGPLSGLLAALGLMFLGWVMAIANLVRIGAALTFWESASLTVGGDGRKMRAAWTERRQMCSASS